jgi:hypothetical protein
VRRSRRYAAALLIFCAAITASLHAVVAHPGSRIPAGFNDATGTIRDYWAASAQHRNPFTLRHDALIGAPQGFDLAPATTVANGGLQTAFVWALRRVLGLVGAWNAFLFLGLLATGMAMFALLDRLGCSFAASLFGAYVFAFSPYAFERVRAGHLGLLHNWVFVVLAGLLIRLHRRRSPVWAAAAGATIGVAFYLSAYQGLLATLTALTFFVVDFARRPGTRERLRVAGLAAASYLVCALSLIPILVLYARERSTVRNAVSHEEVDVYRYAATVGAYLLPSPRNPLFHWLRGIHSIELTEGTLFFGYTTLALALAAVVLLCAHDPWLRASDSRRFAAISVAVLVPAAFLMSLPPRYTIGAVSIPMPSRILGVVSSFWRGYSRLGLLVGFGLAVLAALALTALGRRPGRGWRLLAPLALVVAALELLPGQIHAFATDARPDWVTWLAAQPRGIVATYPIDLLVLNTQDYWYQKLDGKPRFSFGIDSGNPAVAYSRDQAIRLLARDLDDPLTPGILAAEGVRYVIVHDDFYAANGRGVPSLDPPHFELLRQFGSVRVFSVHAPKADVATALRAQRFELAQLQGLVPPGVTYGAGFNAPEQYNGFPSRWMIEDGELEVANADPSMKVMLTGLAFSNQRPRTLEVEDANGRVLARQAITTAEAPLDVGPLPLPHGTSSLTLVAVPGAAPLGPSDSREASIFLTQLALKPVAVYPASTTG